MPLGNDEREAAKERIIKTSERLFSEKGYDATRVDEIAKEAQVNKALIYYYFESKEAILDHILRSQLDILKEFSIDFISQTINHMISLGSLEILSDRFRFSDTAALESFQRRCLEFYERLVDNLLENRLVFRILMIESLKNGKHQNDIIMQYMALNSEKNADAVLRIIKDSDGSVDVTAENFVHDFFFGFIPFINFAAFFDGYKTFFSYTNDDLRKKFLKALKRHVLSFISGTEILFRQD